jgi:hypothetical protein
MPRSAGGGAEGSPCLLVLLEGLLLGQFSSLRLTVVCCGAPE